MTELLIELIGYIGMTLVLLTLILARKHFFKSQIISLFGGIFLAVYAVLTGIIILFILNSIWSLVSIYNLIKSRRNQHANTSKT